MYTEHPFPSINERLFIIVNDVTYDYTFCRVISVDLYIIKFVKYLYVFFYSLLIFLCLTGFQLNCNRMKIYSILVNKANANCSVRRK